MSIYYRAGDLSDKQRRPGRRVAFHEGVADWETLLLGELDSAELIPQAHDAQLEAGQSQESSDLAFSSPDWRTIVLGKCLIFSQCLL